jgi:5-methyltetrahydropteroyltriglutamate--homocysteine methyltransferase
MLRPGVVSHVADRILRYAAIVGRENIVAGTDCGLGGRVHADPAKLRTLSRALASRRRLSGPS